MIFLFFSAFITFFPWFMMEIVDMILGLNRTFMCLCLLRDVLMRFEFHFKC